MRIVSAGFIISSGDSMKQSTGSRLSCPGGESLHFSRRSFNFQCQMTGGTMNVCISPWGMALRGQGQAMIEIVPPLLDESMKVRFYD